LLHAALGWPEFLRAAVSLAALAPLSFAMGLPFPGGLAWLNEDAPSLIPWAWAINGCASVIASVLAAIFALSWGFTVVMLMGAAAYALAGLSSPVTPLAARKAPLPDS
jgi:hypothetical protein